MPRDTSTDYENQNGQTAPEEEVDWDKVDVPIPEGGYMVQCVEAEATVTNDGAKNKITARFEITECDDSANEEAIGRYLFAHMPVTTTGFMLKRYAREAGVDLPSTVNAETCQALAESMVGTSSHCTVTHNEWPLKSGEMRANIQTFGKPNAAAAQAPAANGAANGHANGTANGAAKPTPKAGGKPPAPAPKGGKPPAKPATKAARR